MKKLFVIAILSIFALNLSAQDTPVLDSVMEANFKAEKKALIKEAMQLNEEEAKVFWPLYNEYNEKLLTLNKEMLKIINDNAKNINNLSDDQAEKIWKEKLDHDYDVVKLEKKYFKKMIKVLPAAKAVRYFQAEGKIETMMSAQMAIEVPLINNPE
jgi:hypothetical protein